MWIWWASLIRVGDSQSWPQTVSSHLSLQTPASTKKRNFCFDWKPDYTLQRPNIWGTISSDNMIWNSGRELQIHVLASRSLKDVQGSCGAWLKISDLPCIALFPACTFATSRNITLHNWRKFQFCVAAKWCALAHIVNQVDPPPAS